LVIQQSGSKPPQSKTLRDFEGCLPHDSVLECVWLATAFWGFGNPTGQVFKDLDQWLRRKLRCTE
jgi:hypothetical protein